MKERRKIIRYGIIAKPPKKKKLESSMYRSLLAVNSTFCLIQSPSPNKGQEIRRKIILVLPTKKY